MPGRRIKVVHQQGLVAQAEFIADPSSPYSGIFESGAENVIIRLSETDVVTDGSTRANPSIAIKFLRDR